MKKNYPLNVFHLQEAENFLHLTTYAVDEKITKRYFQNQTMREEKVEIYVFLLQFSFFIALEKISIHTFLSVCSC